ncbi:MAG: hypothetical protein O2963_01300 [Proteobacteria bacterium]|jgi:hypothetical protein|nr:hypothetical protein [Pseudomonadota bacterium]
MRYNKTNKSSGGGDYESTEDYQYSDFDKDYYEDMIESDNKSKWRGRPPRRHSRHNKMYDDDY